MGQQPKPMITDAPWINLTYQIIGLAMELHNKTGIAVTGNWLVLV